MMTTLFILSAVTLVACGIFGPEAGLALTSIGCLLAVALL